MVSYGSLWFPMASERSTSRGLRVLLPRAPRPHLPMVSCGFRWFPMGWAGLGVSPKAHSAQRHTLPTLQSLLDPQFVLLPNMYSIHCNVFMYLSCFILIYDMLIIAYMMYYCLWMINFIHFVYHFIIHISIMYPYIFIHWFLCGWVEEIDNVTK